MLLNEKEDCFARTINENGIAICSVLDSSDCHECTFYKTMDQYEKDKQDALERLRKVGSHLICTRKYKY